MKDSSVPNVLLSGSQKGYAGKNFTKLPVQPILMSNPLNNSKLSMKKLIYNFTYHDTEKKQPRYSILGRVAQSKALCTQKSQHLLSKGHQTHHSGLSRFRHISVIYEPAIKDQLRRHPVFMGNSYLDNFLATEQNKLKSTEMFVCRI